MSNNLPVWIIWARWSLTEKFFVNFCVEKKWRIYSMAAANIIHVTYWRLFFVYFLILLQGSFQKFCCSPSTIVCWALLSSPPCMCSSQSYNYATSRILPTTASFTSPSKFLRLLQFRWSQLNLKETVTLKICLFYCLRLLRFQSH